MKSENLDGEQEIDLLEFCGTDDLQEALRMWEAERSAMAELYDCNEALKIYNRRLRLAIDLTLRLLDELEKGGMFLSPKVPVLAEKVRKVVNGLEGSITQSKMICEE